MKKQTGTFAIYFPDQWNIYPTSEAVYNPEKQSQTCSMYQTYGNTYSVGTDLMQVTSSQSPSCYYDYLFNQKGNALTWTSDIDVSFTSNEDDHTFPKYILRLTSAPNPSNGISRKDASWDINWLDKTPTDLTDNLWIKYEKYSTKFDIAIFDSTSASTIDSQSQNSRTYGTLHHAYDGYFRLLKLIWIIDNNGKVIEEENPIEVVAGLQSDNYYITTGEGWKESLNFPVKNDYIKINVEDEWILFGENDDRTIYKNGYYLPFTVTATNEESMSVKYIIWSSIEQSPDVQYTNLAKTKVIVYPNSEEHQAELIFSIKEIQIAKGATSQPIIITLTRNPASQVDIYFTVVLDQDEQTGIDASYLNSESYVSISPNTLTFSQFTISQSLTVTLSSKWDLSLGISFRVQLAVQGENSESYKNKTTDYVKFDVLEGKLAISPILTVINAKAATTEYSFSGITLQTNGAGYIYSLILPSGQVGPPTGEVLRSWDGSFDMDDYEFNPGSKQNQQNEETDELTGEPVRQLQNDNSTTDEEYEPQFSQWDLDILEEQNQFLSQSYLLLDPYTVYNAQQITSLSYGTKNTEKYLWSQQSYKLYTTYATLDGKYSDVQVLNFTTLDLPQMQYASVTVRSSKTPQGQDLADIICFWAISISFDCNLTKTRQDMIFSQNRRRLQGIQTTDYEIVISMNADPSGLNRQNPKQVLNQAMLCTTCQPKFQSLLQSTDDTVSYQSLGYTDSSANIQKVSFLSKTVPLLTIKSIDEGDYYGRLIYEGYEGNYLFLTLVMSYNETLSIDQILNSLDQKNNQAEDHQVVVFKDNKNDLLELNETEVLFENLDGSKPYIVCAVAMNQYTTVTSGLFSTVECGFFITTGKPIYEEEECYGCDDEGSTAIVLSFCSLLAILTLI